MVLAQVIAEIDQTRLGAAFRLVHEVRVPDQNLDGTSLTWLSHSADRVVKRQVLTSLALVSIKACITFSHITIDSLQQS